MQKISRKSLAVATLSLLLVISMALTFTFAALVTTKKATGTITFTGGVGIVYTGIADTANLEFGIEIGSEGNPVLTGLDSAQLSVATTSKKVLTLTPSIAYLDDEAPAADTVLTALQKLIVLSGTEYNAGYNAGAVIISDLKTVFTLNDVTTLSAEEFNAIINAGTLKVEVTFTAA